MKYFIRDFSEKDISEVINLYQEIFAESPWIEFKKCKKCGVNYGKNEVERVEYYTGFRGQKDNYMAIVDKKGKILSNCKKCGISMKPWGVFDCKPTYFTSENLVDFWTWEDVESDIRFCQSQTNPKILIAQAGETSRIFDDNYEIVGFCWGYKLPIDKFPFLDGEIDKDSGYGDELAVKSYFRRKRIGENLMLELIKSFKENQMKQAIVRTLTTTKAYPLFRKLGFEDIGRVDKNDIYKNRVYLVRDL